MNAWERAETTHISTSKSFNCLVLEETWGKIVKQVSVLTFLLRVWFPHSNPRSQLSPSACSLQLESDQGFGCYAVNAMYFPLQNFWTPRSFKTPKGKLKGKGPDLGEGVLWGRGLFPELLKPHHGGHQLGKYNTDSVLRQYIKHLFSTLENPSNLVSVCFFPESILSIT